MSVEKDSMYVKIFYEKIKNCGNIDCGCKIVDIQSPHITLCLCKKHEQDVKNDREIHEYISPMIDNPEKFESLPLPASPKCFFQLKN